MVTAEPSEGHGGASERVGGRATKLISAVVADDILDASYDGVGTSAGNFTVVAVLKGEPRRWMESVTIVAVDDDGECWGLDYDRGLTEEQPNEYPWERRDRAELIPLYPHVISKTVYRLHPPKAES